MSEEVVNYYRKFAKDNVLVAITTLFNVLGRTLILLPILTKKLGAYNYGLWSQVNVTVVLAMTFIELGLPYTLSRFLAAKTNKEEIREEFYTVFFWMLSVASLSALVIILCSGPISQILFDGESLIVKIAGLIVLIWSLDWTLLNFFRAFREMKKYAIFMIGKIACEIGIIAFLVYNGYGLSSVLFSTFGVMVALFCALFYFVNRTVPLKIPRFSKIQQYLKFGLPTVPGSISSWIVASSDRYIIAFYLGAASVGIYSVGYGFGSLPIMVVGILAFILPPTLSNLYDNNRINEVKIILRYSMKYFLLFAIPFLFGTIVLAHDVIAVLATKEIADKGYFIVPLVALSALCFGFYAITAQILILVKKTKIIGSVWILAALVNFLLNVLIVPHWGILGAAITTVIAYGLAMTLVAYFSFKELKFTIDWNFTAKSIGASIIMALLISVISPANLLSIVVTIFAGMAVYCTVLFLLQGFQKREYLFFKKLISISSST